MQEKWLDRVITVLGWAPTSGPRIPLIAALAVMAASYLLLPSSAPQASLPEPAAVSPALALATLAGRPPSFPGAFSKGAPPPPDSAAAVRAAGADQPVAWQAMTSELEAAAKSYPGSVAIYIKDLKRGWEWSYHADDIFPAASLIKLPVMIAVFNKIGNGEVSLSSPVILRRSVRMGGSGSIKWMKDGSRLTVLKLLEKLIDESDNTAQRMLIDEVGMGYLQRQFPKLGLVFTEIYPEGLSLSSSAVKYENYTTAREMSMLLEKIYKGEAVDPQSSQLMLDILKRRRPSSRLAKTLPPGWQIAHKTGLLRKACHDSSIIFSPDGDYVLTVLTGHNRNYSSAKTFIGRLGRITYRRYGSDQGLLARAGRAVVDAR